jgi:hypothetical protein
MIPLAIAAALLLQQQVPQRRAPAESDFNAVQTESRQAVVDIGRGVAEMRNAHEALRRAVFNSADAMVVERAQELGQSCRDLAALARAASGRICRTCFGAFAQRAMNGYRAVLPSVTQVGTQCAKHLAQYAGARTPAAAVRRNIWSVSRTVVEGLYPYEARVRDVRQAFGLETPPPRRPGR